MSTEKANKSWDRYGRRFALRLSLKRPEEMEIMNEFDRRTALLGKKDTDFFKTCLIAGYKALFSPANPNEKVADRTCSTSSSDSINPADFVKLPANHEGTGIPAKSLLGGLMQHR